MASGCTPPRTTPAIRVAVCWVCISSKVSDLSTAAKSPPTVSARIRCRGCPTAKPWWWPTAGLEPSLVLMQRDGRLLSKETLTQQMNSVRHLGIASDGTIVAGQQFMGPSHESSELLAIKRPGQPFVAFPVGEQQLHAMNHYTASVAVHSELSLVALTAPRGNRFFIWDLDSGHVRLDAPLPDCAGVGAVADGFVVTSGQGRCRYYDCRQNELTAKPLELPAGLWDNHLHLV